MVGKAENAGLKGKEDFMGELTSCVVCLCKVESHQRIFKYYLPANDFFIKIQDRGYLGNRFSDFLFLLLEMVSDSSLFKLHLPQFVVFF